MNETTNLLLNCFLVVVLFWTVLLGLAWLLSLPARNREYKKRRADFEQTSERVSRRIQNSRSHNL
jgi:hypothetical protein